MNWGDIIPIVFSGVRELKKFVDDSRVSATIDFTEQLVSFAIAAKEQGMSPELFVEKLDEMVLELKAKIKYGK